MASRIASKNEGIAPLEEQVAFQLIYSGCEPEPGRFTNDLPVNAEVWFAYLRSRFTRPVGLLLTPHTAAGAPLLRERIEATLGKRRSVHPRVATNESHVLVEVEFQDLMRLLPLTQWWDRYVFSAFANVDPDRKGVTLDTFATALMRKHFVGWLCDHIAAHIASAEELNTFRLIGVKAAGEVGLGAMSFRQKDALRRVVNVSGLFAALTLLNLDEAQHLGRRETHRRLEEQVTPLLEAVANGLRESSLFASKRPRLADRAPLFSVSVNRPVQHALFSSCRTVKADAATRVFDTGGRGVRWAIIDSGIDATHPAFCRMASLVPGDIVNRATPPARSRVVRTLDFTRLAAITSNDVSPTMLAMIAPNAKSRPQIRKKISEIARGLASGQMLDWSKLEPLLEVPHTDTQQYLPPVGTHGTHVAGILGANWTAAEYERLRERWGVNAPVVPEELAENDVRGVCPEIELLDLRVFGSDQGTTEGSDEFAILAAMQYVRYLNQSKDRQYVHGVNLSISLRHEVRSYACGSTPVCLECERLVGSGVIVVAAAGNYGYDEAYALDHLGGAFRGQSITDPGNAPSAITVGSTHRSDPYQYGISYFSSHGPTGDGRNKPDLVAPGEKIVSTIPEVGLASKDGTSMAAPHVSGVAALLLARNNELMGQPRRVKEILCRTASDLGRDKVFQGNGLVDALRALQSV
jgi:serine protease AprX